MGKGKLSQQLRRAIQQAQHLNPNVNLYDYEVPAVVAGDKIEALIYNSTEREKVVVRCEGEGQEDYRKATPKALSKSGALHCKMCLVGGRLPTPEGVKMPHTTEQRFIAVLWGLGMDERFMFQVVPSDPSSGTAVWISSTSLTATTSRLTESATGKTCMGRVVYRCWLQTLSKHGLSCSKGPPW